MANELTGREIVAAVKIAATWRTAVEVGALDGVLITSEGMGAKAPKYVDDDSLGNLELKHNYKMSESLTGGTIEGYMRYENWDVIIALLMGTAGVPTDEGSGAYSNEYYPSDNITGLFATMVVRKSDTAKGIWEIPSCKFHGLTLTGDVGELVKVAYDYTGNKIETESPVNDTAALDAVTIPNVEEANMVVMDSNFKIRMNAEGGAALQDSDKIYPHGFTLKYNRPASEDYSASNIDMDEPSQEDYAEATIELRFDKYNLDDFTTAISNDAEQKIDIIFVGSAIGGAYNYELTIELPRVKFLSADAPVTGPGKIPHTIEGKCYLPNAAPTGMTATTAIYLAVQNKRTTDPLA